MSEEIKNETVEEPVAVELTDDSAVSKSKAKRDARAAEVKAEKAKKNFDQILVWVLGIIIGLIVVGVIGMGIYSSVNKTVSGSDFSACLTEEGFIQGADLSSITDLQMETHVVPDGTVFYLDDEVNADIYQVLENYAYYNQDSSLEVKDGDIINLDYSGAIDGVIFDGGTAANQQLQIGSHSFIDDFEEQLIGYHPGDSGEVTVTFPDPYPNNPDLAGKEAVFTCTVNSIYTRPELTDEFVAQYFSDFATTVDGLKAYRKEQGIKERLETYLANYINENASASKYPSAYVKNMRSLTKYSDEQTYEYYNSYMSYYYGSQMYNSFEDYTGKTESEYEKYLKEQSKKQTAADMTYEAIFRNNNLTIDEEDYQNILTQYGGEEKAIETYGEPYLKQTAIKYAVIKFLEEKVTFNGN